VLRTPTNPTIHQVFTLNPEEPRFYLRLYNPGGLVEGWGNSWGEDERIKV
jgi:hypothetical protein